MFEHLKRRLCSLIITNYYVNIYYDKFTIHQLHLKYIMNRWGTLGTGDDGGGSQLID